MTNDGWPMKTASQNLIEDRIGISLSTTPEPDHATGRTNPQSTFGTARWTILITRVLIPTQSIPPPRFE
jgi:hypothetical protein